MSRPTGRSVFWALLIVGVVLVATAVVMIRSNTPTPTDAGTLAAPATTSAASSGGRQALVAATATPSTTALPPPASSNVAAHTTSSSASARGTDHSRPTPAPPPATSTTNAPQPGRPAVLHLPTLDVTADINPVDSTDGVLQVPDDIATVGWWQHSAPAGSAAGSTVLDGHIDSAAAGEGALFHLADLSPGDPLTVTTTTGATLTYRVQARRVYVKAQGLPANLFDQNVPARLVIISCGGSFDPAVASYRDNIAIFATPTT